LTQMQLMKKEQVLIWNLKTHRMMNLSKKISYKMMQKIQMKLMREPNGKMRIQIQMMI